MSRPNAFLDFFFLFLSTFSNLASPEQIEKREAFFALCCILKSIYNVFYSFLKTFFSKNTFWEPKSDHKNSGQFLNRVFLFKVLCL